MNSVLVYLLLFTPIPIAPDHRCTHCGGDGWRSGWRIMRWWDVRTIERCHECDDYGREKTIYGRLLK